MVAGRRVIRVGVSPWSMLNHLCIPRRRKGCDPGPELEILEIVTTMLNLTLEFRATDVRGCGKLVNGSWIGLSGMLLNDEIDITGNLCDFETKGRRDLLGFSNPVWQYPNAFLTRVPQFQISFQPTAPFSTVVWAAIAAVSAIYWMFLICHGKLFAGRSIVRIAVDTGLNLADSTMGMRADAKRAEWFWILWVGFLGCCFFFYNNYIIRALMASHSVDRPFADGREFARLAAQGRYRLLDYRDPPDISTCFGEACTDLESAVRSGHYSFSANSSGYALLDALVSDERLVLMKGLTFLETYLADYADRERLWLFSDDSSVSESRSVFLWQKRKFAYENDFNRILSKLAEFKLNARTRRTSQTSGQKVRRGNTLSASTVEERALHLADMAGPLLYLLYGIAVSFVGFLAELVCFSFGEKLSTSQKYEIGNGLRLSRNYDRRFTETTIVADDSNL